MDTRVLRYFLTIANVGNITKAAELLHITQPTLSRQMMELEKELGTTLLVRGKRQVTLTNAGLLFQQKAKEMILLMEKTERDLLNMKNLVGGVVSIGCVESIASIHLADIIMKFSAEHPMVQYELYSANGDDIRDKIDGGMVDIGLLLEPIETAKYDYIRLPLKETWGLLIKSDDPLARAKHISVKDILPLPLIPPRRRIIQDEIAGWLGVESEQLNIIASHNLLTNAIPLVERGLGYAICVQGAFTIRETDAVRFVPFLPKRQAGHVLAWKKNRIFGDATTQFIDAVEMHFKHGM